MPPIADLWPFTKSAHPGLAVAAAGMHAILVVLAFYAARKVRPRFWVAVGIAQLVLSLDAAFGFRVRVADVIRESFQSRGLYDWRYVVQSAAVAVLIIGLAAMVWRFRREPRRSQLAIAATGMHFLLLLTATVSLHQIDALLRYPHPLLGVGNGLRCLSSGLLVLAIHAEVAYERKREYLSRSTLRG